MESTENQQIPIVENNLSNAMAYYKTNYRYTSLKQLEKYHGSGKKASNMNGVKRVFAFCCLTAILPACLIICPLYLKHQVFKDHIYHVTESDILEIRDGMSTIFCQEHRLKMNTSFNAFQLTKMPNLSTNRKHIRLRKSMELPDDTLEYWGFFLLKGATVKLNVCSRYVGARVMIVKGQKNLNTCALLEHNKQKLGANYDPIKSQVKILYEYKEVVSNLVEEKHQNNKNKKFHLKDNVQMDSESMLNNGGEDFSEKKKVKTRRHIKYPLNNLNNGEIDGSSVASINYSVSPKMRNRKNSLRKMRSHPRRHLKDLIYRPHALNKLEREKRDTVLDRGIAHGGNAQKIAKELYNNNNNDDSSTSSFELSLYECWGGDILFAHEFNSTEKCVDSTMDSRNSLATIHEIESDGYYYYVFYSDNDIDKNTIHAIFEIEKPTYLYSNISESKGCINSTDCKFPVQMFSDEIVIVEVPTRDGIEDEAEDVTILYSECVPRMAVYVIFPIAVLVLVLSCAFI